MAQSVQIPLAAGKGTVHGYCDERFEAVLDAFVANFNSDEEVGASISINIASLSVVSLIAIVPEREWRIPTLIVS